MNKRVRKTPQGANYFRVWRAARKARGACVRCGGQREDTRYVDCAACREARRAYATATKGQRRAYRQSVAEQRRWYWIERRTGVTKEMYEAAIARQGGRCAICGGGPGNSFTNGRPQRFFDVDHCHDTGRFRGLLCGFCNRGIGMLPSVDRLLSAVSYLARPVEELIAATTSPETNHTR